VVSDFLRAAFRQATCDGFHYLTDAMFPQSGFGIPNSGSGSWYYRQEQGSRILHGFGSMFEPFFKESYGVPFTAVCTPHLLGRASGFISQAALPGFGWIFFELNHFVSVSHLQNGEVLHVRNVVVLTASDPMCSDRCLKLAFVRATPL